MNEQAVRRFAAFAAGAQVESVVMVDGVHVLMGEARTNAVEDDRRRRREAEERREQPQLVFGEHRSSGVILHRRVVQLAHDPDPADFTCERLPLSTEGVLRVFRRGNHAATAG